MDLEIIPWEGTFISCLLHVEQWTIGKENLFRCFPPHSEYSGVLSQG